MCVVMNGKCTIDNSASRRAAGPESRAQEDERWMSLAVAEAKRGLGHTRPNPPVGCVIVRDGTLLACGHHAYAGGPHAEAAALSTHEVGFFRGSTLYVTLEPCCTYGRTPPCTEAIIRHGISRVVTACTDPNPRHNGRSLDILRQAGVTVDSGVLEHEAAEVLRPFFKWVTRGMSYLTLKMAQTLDGAIADHAGQSKWITCGESRAEVGEMRKACDAVLVGAGTVIADNPSLLRPGEDGKGQPGFRIAADSMGRIPTEAKIFTDGLPQLTICAVSEQCPRERIEAFLACGATVWTLPQEIPSGGGRPRLSIEALLRKAAEEGLLHIMCEGGAALASHIVNGGLADELDIFIAPAVFGAGSKRTFGEYPFDLPTAPSFRIESHRQVGCDLLLRLVNDSRLYGAAGQRKCSQE